MFTAGIVAREQIASHLDKSLALLRWGLAAAVKAVIFLFKTGS
jgi:hypothetical protein